VDTIDFEPPRPSPALDAAEFQVSRQFSQYIRIIKNIQQTVLMYGKLKKKTDDWALDTSFIDHNKDYPLWLQQLPEDMQIIYPDDGSPPWIPSHYIANMHTYHYLGVIMHLRPQLHAVADSYDGTWKQHMLSCYSAAKNMCKLQEAVIKTYGLPGLLCMQRGISFTIYAVLTCTMLHLVSTRLPIRDNPADPNRLQLLAPTPISITTPGNSLSDTCASWRSVLLYGRCRKCSSK
jgi:hypothetical protein